MGTDLVHVPGLAEQLGQPGTVFAERAFTPRERREAARRSREKGSAQAEHLAARWAAKESFIKAWSQALVLRARATGASDAPVIAPQSVDWRQVEVVSDRWGRPSLHLVGEVADAVEASLGAGSAEPGRWPVSLTHDGNWAAAVVLYTPARWRPGASRPAAGGRSLEVTRRPFPVAPWGDEWCVTLRACTCSSRGGLEERRPMQEDWRCHD